MNLRHALLKKHNSFDLYVFDYDDPDCNRVFAIHDCPFDAVSKRWDKKRCNYYLDFKFGNTTVSFLLQMPVIDHMKLCHALGLLND